MRRWIVATTIRFILRRLLTQDAINLLYTLVEETDKAQHLTTREKKALVKNQLRCSLSSCPEYLLNLIIELGVTLERYTGETVKNV